VAGARVTPVKIKTQTELLIHNQLHVDRDEWKINASDLTRTLEANSMILVGDGERFSVMNKKWLLSMLDSLSLCWV
jgi:hypothetical protein